MTGGIWRRVTAEALGTAMLLATIVGSGIMAERLFAGQPGLSLLANSLATGAVLFALINTFGPISGAHFNPVVTLTQASGAVAARYVPAQCAGAAAGVWLAHAMFGERILMVASRMRSGPSQWLSEFVATFGLIAVVTACSRRRPHAVPGAVAAYIVAAYWFTASTSFANPAVTLARAFTDTFAGIRPSDTPGFVVAQVLGGVVAVTLSRWLSHGVLARSDADLPASSSPTA